MKTEKYLVSSYTYTAATKTILINDAITFDITSLNSIVNETTGDILYSGLNNSEFGGAINRMATVLVKTITLGYDGSVAGMNDADDLSIIMSLPKDSIASPSSTPDGDNTYYAKPNGSNADASVSYTSATTITVSGLPFSFNKFDIEKITRVPLVGSEEVFDNNVDFSVFLGVITISGSALVATDEFIVVFSGPDKAYDKSLDGIKTLEQSKALVFNTTPITIANSTVGNVNDVWIDKGPTISAKNIKSIGVYYVMNANNSTGNQIRIQVLSNSGSIIKYVSYVDSLSDVNGSFKLNPGSDYDVSSDSFIQIQTKATIVGVIPSNITIEYTLVPLT